MTTTDQSRALHRAAALENLAHELPGTIGAALPPFESYLILGEIVATQRHLAQLYSKLADWHSQAVDEIHYNGEDGRGEGLAPAIARTELALRDAADFAGRAEGAVIVAHAASGVICWFDFVQG